MKNRKSPHLLKFILTLFILSSIAILSCSKDDKPTIDPDPVDPLAAVKKYTFEIMTDIYYWYDQVPRNIYAPNVKTIFDYFDTLLVKQDRWSWMMTGEQYLSSETGVVKSYGISLGQAVDYYDDYSVRVRYVHPNSPMDTKGVKRGFKLTHLNGVSVNSLISDGTFNSVFARENNAFTFLDHDNKEVSFDLSAQVINTRSYLKKMVITPNDYPGLSHNIGYFNYLSFKAQMLDDISDAIQMFKDANIKELILDLRYNGGGDSRATSLLANLIAKESAHGKILAKRSHNNKYKSLDANGQTIIEREPSKSLNLDRIYILTTRGSASASEVILNGLKPLMNIVQVGSTTYGKPNGMYVMPYPEGNYDNPSFVFLPTSFFTVNSEGYGDYADGLVPDHYRPDDLFHDFGLSDDWLKACLHYSVNGAFPPLPSKPSSAFYSNIIRKRVAVPEDSPNYGVYKVVL